MQTGLKVVNLEDGEIANFYFAEDGVMRTGKQVIYNEDLDENQTWFFYTDGSRKGQGFHGIRDNTLYEASSSSKSATKPELGNGFKDYKDSNGKTWVVDVNGIIQ